MKKDKLFDLIHDFIYGLEPDRPELEGQLFEIGIDINELWGEVDSLLMKIAEKYGED